MLGITLLTSAQSYSGARTLSPSEKLNNQYCSPLFRYAEGTIFNLENDPTTSGYLNILNWLQGRVPGLQLVVARDGTPIPLLRAQVPGLFVDEMPVSINFLNTLPVEDIAMIKVIKTPFYGGFGSGAGAIAVYTYPANDEDSSLSDNQARHGS